MDNISITENNNLHVSETPNSHVQGDPNVFINSNIVQIGDDMSIKIGSTETLPSDSNAYVRNSGDDKNVILNFGLVRGQNGRDGLDGRAGVDGVDGFSPIATITQTPTGATISVTDATQTTTANITNGTDGTDGFSPIANVTRNSDSATITVTDEIGTTTATVYDGISPTATVTQTPTGADISITSASGTTTASVTNGIDGTDGTDGFSPIATVTQNTGYATITITDKNGTTTANVYDGTDAPIPNDGTLTIQKNGTTVQTFTANQSSNVTANISVPTQFSDLSGTIGTNQISNTAITNSKIDWTDLFSNSDVYHVGSGGTEQIVGKWNDGKYLYRTVVWIGLGENVESVVDMTSYNISEIVQFFEVMKTTDGSYFPAYYYANGDDWARWYYGGTDKKIHAISRWGSRGMILTLYYTKAS